MTDRPVIHVFHERRRWYVQIDGDAPLAAHGRRRAVDAALDLAETVAPARVEVFTADGRLRRTITVGAEPGTEAPATRNRTEAGA